MITDCFDRETEPIIRLKDFYGEIFGGIKC